MKRSFIQVHHSMKLYYSYQGKKHSKTIHRDTVVETDEACTIKIRVYDDDFINKTQMIWFVLKYIMIGVFCIFIDSLHQNMKSFCFTDNVLCLQDEKIIDLSVDQNGALILEHDNTIYHARLIRSLLTVGSVIFFAFLIFLIGFIIHHLN